MSVSIVLATYNGARFIREQLESLARQEHRPSELVVTDDSSTDDTLAIVADFARTAPFPVRVSRNEPRLGFRGNFMHGAGLCKGDLIAFCDQDDIWLPNKLSVQVRDFEDAKVLASSHNATLIDATGRELGRELRQFSSHVLTYRNTSPFSFSRGFTLVIRRSLLDYGAYFLHSKDIGDPEHSMSHDQWFFFLSVVLGKIRYHDTVLCLYRQHDSNWSGAVETPRRKIIRQLSDRRSEYERLPIIWQNRADLMAMMLAEPHRFTPENLRAMEAVRALYLALHDATERRQALYQAETVLARIACLAQSVFHGDYRPRSLWHFSLRGAVRDLFVRSSGAADRKGLADRP